MTTPKGETSGPAKPKVAHASGRVRRPPPAAQGPNRDGAAAGAEVPASKAADAAADTKVGDAVAHIVKLGYDVIAENIQQGREAAERFSKGKYNIREAPGDLEVAAQRMLHLARELSTTTFDVCERLLKEVAAPKAPADRASTVPPFKAPVQRQTAKPSPADAGVMKVTVQFEGAPKGIAHTTSLERPRRPAAANEVVAQPLTLAEGSGPTIADVTFKTDISIEGIVALVRVPGDHPHGVYSGLVRVKGDPIPLGVLTIELPK